jgi:hypothetical protein
MNLTPFLDDLESRLDTSIEDAIEAQWKDFVFHGVSPVFSPRRAKAAPSKIEWPNVSVNETRGDDDESYDRMALQQLRGVSGTLENGGGAMLNVRCNYGTVIFPTLFGAPEAIMDDCYNTLPTAVAIPGGMAGIRRVVASPLPHHEDGWGRRVFEMGRRFRAILDSRPKLKRYVHLYHPDIQGPLDVAELCVGSDIFLAFHDEAELMLALLDRVTIAYENFLDAWLAMNPPPSPDWNVHWGVMHRGHAMLRLDSGMNLSPDMLEKFSLPFDARLFKRYGGGLHSCGRVDHFFGAVARLEGCHCLNLSQPSYNDMDLVYRETLDVGVRFFNHDGNEARRLIEAKRANTHLIHSPWWS